MTDDGLFWLGGALVFSAFLAFGLKTGNIAYARTLSGVRYVERSKNPTGFWIIVALLALCAVRAVLQAFSAA